LLDRVSTIVLGLDGQGGAKGFADYSQWEAWQEELKQPKLRSGLPSVAPRPEPSRKKLSYLDAREYAGIEQRIAEAEQALAAMRAGLEDPAVLRDGRRLEVLWREIEEAQQAVDSLYARWAELDAGTS
jgi:ATP-binding cassette subfamily F protein uup